MKMIDRLPLWILVVGYCMAIIFLNILVAILFPADSPIPLLFSIAIGAWCGMHIGWRIGGR